MEVWSFVKGREQLTAVEGESLLHTHALRHILRVHWCKLQKKCKYWTVQVGGQGRIFMCA